MSTGIRRLIIETIEGMPRLDVQAARHDELAHAMGQWVNLFDLQISLEPILAMLITETEPNDSSARSGDAAERY